MWYSCEAENIHAYSEGRPCCYCEAAIAWSQEEYEKEHKTIVFYDSNHE